MKKQWSMVIVIVLVLLISGLSVLNVDPVPVNFGFTQVDWPLILVIIGSLLIGAIIASILSTMRIYKERKLRKEAQKELGSSKEREASKVSDVEQQYEAKISKLEAELEEEKRKERDLERRLSNTEQTNKKENPL